MRPGERSANLVLALVTVILALIIGIAIPLASGGSMRDQAPSWTPPPTRTATPTSRAIALPTLAPLTSPTAARQPTAVPPAALPTAAPAPPTFTPAPSATPSLTATPSPTATLAPAASPTPVTPAATPAGPTARVLAEPVNLRAGPGTDFTPLGIARLGEVYALRGRNADGSWYQVCCVQGAPAWISATLVSTEGITDTLPIVP